MQSHRAELEELSSKDPEFYKFLKEQDADLLEFNESDYEIDEGEGGEGKLFCLLEYLIFFHF